MPFVVKTSDRVGTLGWFAARIGHGLYTIGSRAHAKVFHRFTQADAAIRAMRPTLDELGLNYRVEVASEQAEQDVEDRYFRDPAD